MRKEVGLRVTIKKIAEELGVSHSTVSRVLNDKQSNLVSGSMRDRIVETARRMGYRPSRIAQALQGKGTQLVGVHVPDTEDFFFQTVIRHLRLKLGESGYELLVFTSTREKISATWQRLLQWDLDGVFVFDYLFYVEGLWDALTRHEGAIPPIVGLFSSQTQLTDYVTVDFGPAMEELLAHLRDQGCQRFGYMALPTSFHPNEQRYRVFCEFVSRNGLEQWSIPTAAGPDSLMEAGRQGLTSWVRQHLPLPNALFCQNDEIAIGAYSALRDAGVRVPGEVALAGCDDLPFVSYLETPLTSLVLPVEQVCRMGWEVLQKRIAQPDGQPMQVALPVSVELRASSFRQAAVVNTDRNGPVTNLSRSHVAGGKH